MSDEGNRDLGYQGDRGRHYLESSVRTASPARLRLMLLERAVEVAASLSARWNAGQDLGANELSLRLLDLLTELLAGVKGSTLETEDRLCRQVADLYVFLTQHLLQAEKTSQADAIDEIRIVLETEVETWRLVCAREISPAARNMPAGSQAWSGLDLHG